MQPELILCVPGPWKDRSDLVRSSISETKGEFMFAGMILACPGRKDHVQVTFAPPDPQLKNAFEIAGQGKLQPELLEQIGRHNGLVYVHFPIQIIREKDRVGLFTNVIKRCGGLAVKIESAGIAHGWDHWFSILSSENPFDLYRSFVVLIGDTDHYYSCGMHHFGLPDLEVDRSLDIKEAADLMNRFNFWQIAEEPKIASGHTFSLTPSAPQYRMTLHGDFRHETGDLFHNANGVWNLKRTP
jgi:hypothetical protein